MTDVTAPAGSDLGLPATGPGRLAGWGPRLLALVVDWAIGYVLALVLLGHGDGLHGGATFVPLALFAAECWVGTALAAGSIGQLLVGLRVVRADRRLRGRFVDPLHAALRVVLLVLVVPAVVFDRDRRGLHDRAAGTVVISRR